MLAARAAAQGPVVLTREAAIAAALARNPQLAIARADTLQALGELLTARGLPNPALSASYSKSVPRYHVTAELPLDLLGVRGTRIRSAEAARTAAQYRFAFARAAASLDADTTYTRALAAAAKMELSARNAVAADSVRRIAVARRDAGDASELDVQLAIVSAGQAENAAAADSLLLATTLLDLQSLVGIAGQEVAVRLADTLAAPGALPGPSAGATLPVAGATAALESASLAVTAQHRSVWLLPGITFGFEAGDPTGAEPGILPTFGITLPLPFLNRNRGPIAEADAARQRAQAELDFARVDGENRIASARRTGASAAARLGRDQLLVASANRVAAMSLTAYREGAAPLATVLEAQRSAREILGQYIDDVAAATIAASLLRVLTLTPSSVTTP